MEGASSQERSGKRWEDRTGARVGQGSTKNVREAGPLDPDEDQGWRLALGLISTSSLPPAPFLLSLGSQRILPE